MGYDVLSSIARTMHLHSEVGASLFRPQAVAYSHIQAVLETQFGLKVHRTQAGVAATLRSSRAQFPPYLTIKLNEDYADPNAMFVHRVGPALIQVYEGGEDGLEGTGQGAAYGWQQEDQVVLP